MSGLLGPLLKPCGPVVDPVAADRALERLSEAAREDRWSDALQAAWPSLAPAFAASPYLAGLARRWPAGATFTWDAASQDGARELAFLVLSSIPK
jgi:glutamate-ammonia-ligase adenylyltransferase